MPGEIGILNVGAGDTKLVFDASKPDEVANASRIVKDMIRRGFALFIEIGQNEKGPIYQRAHDFDEATAEYIIAGPASDQEEKTDGRKPTSAPRPRNTRQKGGQTKRRVPASTTNAVAVARISGG